jgi:Rrf2 family protein
MLTQRGRYALKALLNLARGDGGPRDVGTISAEENIPRKFLEAIMSDLRRARLVESTRGKLGGYRLARPADLITFGEIMRVTNGPLALISCASRAFYRRCNDCPDEAACVLRRVLGSVRDEVSEILDRTTLAAALASPALTEVMAGADSEGAKPA